MSWGFRKRIKIIPGVHINLSTKGISTTIGIPGASVNVNQDGVYRNLGIPGTGLYSREQILNYKDLLAQMGFEKVKSYLFYAVTQELKEV